MQNKIETVCPKCGFEFDIDINEAILKQIEDKIKEHLTAEFIEEKYKLEDKYKQQLRQFEEEKHKLLEEKEDITKNSKEEIEIAKRKIQEEYDNKHIKDEYEKVGLRQQVIELQRKLEQGSQQIQGEALEFDLEHKLIKVFPSDSIESVKIGEEGGDIIQKINTDKGLCCGSIIWECKNTKNFYKEWIEKLKNDQVKVNAEHSIIVTKVLPKEIEEFGYIDSVLITSFKSAIKLGSILRNSVIELATEKLSSKGKNEKKELLYNYINDSRFKGKITHINDIIESMREQVNSEKRKAKKNFDKREEDIDFIETDITTIIRDINKISMLEEKIEFKLEEFGPLPLIPMR